MTPKKIASFFIFVFICVALFAAFGGKKFLAKKFSGSTAKSPRFVDDDIKIEYSLFDASTQPALESAAERSKLAEYIYVPGDSSGSYKSGSRSKDYGGWLRSNGDGSSSKYSSLSRINRANVGGLKLAWVYHSGEGDWKGKPGHADSQMNPVMADGKVFTVIPSGKLAAVNASTGEELWRSEFPGPPARRGLLWWPGNKNTSPRLYLTSGQRLYAVDPATGKLIKGFGDGGSVELARHSLTAPAYLGDRIFVTTFAPDVEAFQIETGEFLWSRSLISSKSGKVLFSPEFRNGANPWSGFSVDESRSAVIITTGNVQHNMSGVKRPGPNRYANSVLSIDAASGLINWDFQEIEHDIWDMDLPAPPVLTSVKLGGKLIDVVAAVTKMGNTLLLNRDTGRPIFDYRKKRAPISTLPGERTAPYQPALVLPEPFLKREFKADDLSELGVRSRESVRGTVARSSFGFFIPPDLKRNTIQYGIVGGAEWPGAAADQATGVLYVPSEQIPAIHRIYLLDSTPKAREPLASYERKCASCHGENREGQYKFLAGSWAEQRQNITTMEVAPSLAGITAMRSQRELLDRKRFLGRHSETPSLNSITEAELEDLYNYFSDLDHYTDAKRGFILAYNWWNLLDREGYPASKPPWGLINAIDLNTGKILWRKPFGEYAELTKRGMPVTGQHNLGGLIVTAGGLVFATGTLDQKIRALDSSTGQELWSYELPTVGSAPPSTYEWNGKQYLVVVAHGGRYPHFNNHADALLAFSIEGQ